MANPKVKKGKSGSKNDSTQQAERLRQFKRGGDPGLISEKTANTMKKKK